LPQKLGWHLHCCWGTGGVEATTADFGGEIKLFSNRYLAKQRTDTELWQRVPKPLLLKGCIHALFVCFGMKLCFA